MAAGRLMRVAGTAGGAAPMVLALWSLAIARFLTPSRERFAASLALTRRPARASCRVVGGTADPDSESGYGYLQEVAERDGWVEGHSAFDYPTVFLFRQRSRRYRKSVAIQ